MQYPLALTQTSFISRHLFSFSFFFSFLSTKVGVHVTGIVLRGRSLKMVKPPPPRGDAPAKLSLRRSEGGGGPPSPLPSSLPVLIISQTAAVFTPGSLLKGFYF